ncbi:MAG: GNAT family N-acetyltransferase [Jatrophihabitans sp.]|nr:MAG: GNAT family N-acetyltransferase [Jatrophihabitans sp.]
MTRTRASPVRCTTHPGEQPVSRANVRVRPAAAEDIPGLVDLTRSVDLYSGQFSGRPIVDDGTEHLTRRFAEILAEGVRTLLVAVDDSLVVGLLVARPDTVGAIDLTPVLHVSHLLVTPSHRRRGVGRALLAAVVHVAEERGVDRLVATVASGSREGNRYLARLGFAPLVVHRVASVSGLRRSLGLADLPERMAVLRRARLLRGQRSVSPRAARRA